MPFLLFAALVGSAIGDSLEISTADELIQFRTNVKGGTTYEGTTVLLSSDIDLTEKALYPIGGYDAPQFLGVFDGQGYVIRNLVMESTSDYVGLFGYSAGLTVRNVIIDSSCSIKSSYGDGRSSSIGAFVGECKASKGPCTIENSVNMASVTFAGNVGEKYLYFGGIAGGFDSVSHKSTVQNCANYGDLTDSGTSYSSEMGGVVGYSYGRSSSTGVHIYNSISYGTITHSGTTTNSLYIGGITGDTYYVTIENCVVAGKIESTGTASGGYTGSIAGYVGSGTFTNYCYITSELSSLNKYGYADETIRQPNAFNYNSATFEFDESVSVEGQAVTSLISALNAVSDSHTDYSHWLLNKDSKAVTFAINGRTAPISMNYQIILTPSLVSEGAMSFDGWYTDDALATPLASYEVTADTALYGAFCAPELTVTLNENGGDELAAKEMKTGCEGTYGELPTATRTGYTFDGWFTEQTEGTKVESGGAVAASSDHTLYAHWTVKQYTLTFVVNGGTECEPITQDYNTAIALPETTKTDYIFGGWYSDSELTTPFTETTMPAENKTLYAKWNTNQYTLTFVANGGTECEPITQESNTSITLPEPTKTGYTFGGWYSDSELTTPFTETTMPAENKILYAKWDIKKYTATFVANGVTETRTFSAGEAIDYPENPEREGFTFAGWSPKPETMPAEDITIVAQWTVANPVECVEIMFSQDDLTEDAAEEIIKGLSPEGAKFTIEKFEGIRTVVKFNNKKDAASFVEAAETSSSIASADFFYEGCSFASSLGLSALAFFLAYFFSF